MGRVPGADGTQIQRMFGIVSKPLVYTGYFCATHKTAGISRMRKKSRCCCLISTIPQIIVPQLQLYLFSITEPMWQNKEGQKLAINLTCPLSFLRRVSETGNLLRFVRRQGELPWLPHESCILPVSLTRLREDMGQVGLVDLFHANMSLASSFFISGTSEKIGKYL